MFRRLESLQDKYSAKGKVSVVYVKIDDPKNLQAVLDALRMKLEDYKVFSMDEFVSLISVDNIPILKRFTRVVIGLAVVVGFLVVFLSMYTAVLERTREIGILKALGASPGYIMDDTSSRNFPTGGGGRHRRHPDELRHASLILRVSVPTMPMLIAHAWWPWSALIALAGSLIGAIYPGFKAAQPRCH